MNYFTSTDKFYLSKPLFKTFDALDGLMPLVSSIRKNLNDQSHELDNYFKTMLQVCNLSFLSNALDAAMEDYSRFRRISIDILDGKTDIKSDPYFVFVFNYIELHKAKYRDRSFLITMATATAALSFAKEVINKYMTEINKDFDCYVDIVELRKGFRAISYATNEFEAERLDDMISNVFYIAPTGSVYVQEYINFFVLDLITCDKISGKYAYQFILEEMF
mgnify:FL=1|jgi:hypothetical protein|nr:MAG TPA: hypothetical protein [Caudoviricetes sp.]